MKTCSVGKFWAGPNVEDWSVVERMVAVWDTNDGANDSFKQFSFDRFL